MDLGLGLPPPTQKKGHINAQDQRINFRGSQEGLAQSLATPGVHSQINTPYLEEVREQGGIW